AAQRGVLGKKTNDSKIAAHRAQVQEGQKKVAEAMDAITGKLEQDLYVKAEDEVEALSKVLSAGEALGAGDPKYAQELKVAAAPLPGLRLKMRIVRVQAANASLQEKMKALEGAAEDSAFSAAEEALRVYGTSVEAAKSFSSTDKSYLAFVAAQEK